MRKEEAGAVEYVIKTRKSEGKRPSRGKRRSGGRKRLGEEKLTS
jgi:hypothetical protein